VGLYQVMSAFRQACGAGVRWGFMASNPAQAVGQNPQAPVVELEPLTIREVEALAVELGPVYGSAVIVACETATRPSEWAGLQRRDVDRERGVVRVERTVVDGREKPYGKTTRSRRSIPLSSRALEALNELPIQLTSPYLFPAARGGPIGLDSWRSRCWYPALESAGIERCGPICLAPYRDHNLARVRRRDLRRQPLRRYEPGNGLAHLRSFGEGLQAGSPRPDRRL
jgi:integrase